MLTWLPQIDPLQTKPKCSWCNTSNSLSGLACSPCLLCSAILGQVSPSTELGKISQKQSSSALGYLSHDGGSQFLTFAFIRIRTIIVTISSKRLVLFLHCFLWLNGLCWGRTVWVEDQFASQQLYFVQQSFAALEPKAFYTSETVACHSTLQNYAG